MKHKWRKLLSVCFCAGVCALCATPVFAAEAETPEAEPKVTAEQAILEDSALTQEAQQEIQKEETGAAVSENKVAEEETAALPSESKEAEEETAVLPSESNGTEAAEEEATEATPNVDGETPEVDGTSEEQATQGETETEDDSVLYKGELGNLKWVLDKDGCLTISGNGSMTDFTFFLYAAPWLNAGGDDAGTRLLIKRVVIENGVTRVGARAFVACENLETVTIADSVISVGAASFGGCRNLKSVVMSNSVTTIEETAFASCISLSEINLPNTLTTIGEGAFACCAFTQLVIPDSVTSIGERAFRECESLEEITIPDSVTTIGKGVFNDSNKLKLIRCNPNTVARKYATENGYNYECITHTLENPVVLEPTCIRDGCEIGKCKDCDFDGKIVIPAKGAEGHAWSDYVVDKEATPFEAGQESIYCTNCGEVKDTRVIPQMDKATGTIGNVTWTVYPSGTLEFKGEGEIPAYKISDGVTTGPWGKYYKNIKTITVGNGITRIGKYAFYGMNVAKATVASSVKKIDTWAFAWCRSLKDVTLEGKVEDMASDVFYMTNSKIVVSHPAGHQWNDGTITTAPTCTEAGVKTYKCTVFGCDAEKTEEVAATGHNFVHESIAATLLKDGSEYDICTVCGLKINEKTIASQATSTLQDSNVGAGSKALTSDMMQSKVAQRAVLGVLVLALLVAFLWKRHQNSAVAGK